MKLTKYCIVFLLVIPVFLTYGEPNQPTPQPGVSVSTDPEMFSPTSPLTRHIASSYREGVELPTITGCEDACPGDSYTFILGGALWWCASCPPAPCSIAVVKDGVDDTFFSYIAPSWQDGCWPGLPYCLNCPDYDLGCGLCFHDYITGTDYFNMVRCVIEWSDWTQVTLLDLTPGTYEVEYWAVVPHDLGTWPAGVCSFNVAEVYATDLIYTWNGSVDTNWTNTANWTVDWAGTPCGRGDPPNPPDETNPVIIPAGCPNYPQLGTIGPSDVYIAKDLTLQTGAHLYSTYNNYNRSINGDFEVQTGAVFHHSQGKIWIYGNVNIDGAWNPSGGYVVCLGDRWNDTDGEYRQTYGTTYFYKTGGTQTVTCGADNFFRGFYVGYNNTTSHTLSLTTPVDINGSFTMRNSSKSLVTNWNNMEVSGNWTLNGGTFTHNNNTVYFDGNGSINGNTKFYNLVITGGTRVQDADEVTVESSSSFEIQAGAVYNKQDKILKLGNGFGTSGRIIINGTFISTGGLLSRGGIENFYNFVLNAGGVIGIKNTTFEYMRTINLAALVNPFLADSLDLDACTFQDWSTSQALVLHDSTNIPASAMSFFGSGTNIMYLHSGSGPGTVNVTGGTGTLWGEAYDGEPEGGSYNFINWGANSCFLEVDYEGTGGEAVTQSGGGWFAQGTGAPISTQERICHGDTCYALNFWYSTPAGAAFGDSTADATTITMDQSYIAMASYQTQYFLHMGYTGTGVSVPLQSDSGWFPAGSEVVITTQDTVSAGDTVFVFDHWTTLPDGAILGDSSNSTTTLTMTESFTAIAHYHAEYRLEVDYTGTGVEIPAQSGSGYYIPGAIAAIATQDTILLGDTRYIFEYWNSSPEATYLDDDSASGTTILVDQAYTVTANYYAEFYLDLEYTGGAPYVPVQTGEGWYRRGSVIGISTSDWIGIEADRYIFRYWSSTPPGADIADSISPITTVSIDTAYTITAHYAMAYRLTIEKIPFHNEGYVFVEGSAYPDTGLVSVWVDPGAVVEIGVSSFDSSENTLYYFDAWEDSSEDSSRTVGPIDSDTTFQAYYWCKYRCVVEKDPAEPYGFLTIDRTTWYDFGSLSQTVWLNEDTTIWIGVSEFDYESDTIRYDFLTWSDGGSRSHSTAPIAGPTVFTAYYNLQNRCRIEKAPYQDNGSISLDGYTYDRVAYLNFWAYEDSTYLIGVSELDNSRDSLYLFSHWSDSGEIEHTTAPIGGVIKFIAHYVTFPMDLRVCLSDTVWDIGEMNPGELRTMNPAEVLEVANCGGVVLDFGLKILDSGSYWADHHIVELDRYTLKARFLDTLEVPALFHHVRDLVHSDTLTWATDSIFGDRGFNIDTGEANNLWLQFGAPSASSIYEESQAIMLEIRCRVHLP